MAQHLLIADLAALLIVPRADRARCSSRCWRSAGSAGCAHLGNPLVALPLWALNLYVWHLAALYQGRPRQRAAPRAQHACFFGFGVAMWMPLVGPLPMPSWFGGRRRSSATWSPSASPAPCSATSSCGRARCSIPTTRPGEAERGICAAGRPGHGGDRDDDRGRRRHARRACLAVLRWAAKRDTERQQLLDLADRARRPARPRLAPTAPSPPARARRLASGSSVTATHDAALSGNRFLYAARLRGRHRRAWAPRSPRRG